MLVMLRLALPVFVRVACKGTLVLPWFWLPKSKLPGESDAASVWPVPVSCMVCGPFTALLVTVSTADRAPEAEGRKLTFTLQLLPPLTVAHCPGATLKSAALAPLTARPETVRSWLPVSAIRSGKVLLVPFSPPPKFRLGETLMVGGVYAVPVSWMELLRLTPGMLTVRLPVCVPAAVGLKVTDMTQP